MAIEVTCPCTMRFKASDRTAGLRVSCPSCGKPVAVPVPPLGPVAPPARPIAPVVAVEPEPLRDEPEKPSLWSRIGQGTYRAVTCLASPELAPTASTPPPKPMRFTRRCLGWVAAFSFLGIASNQLAPIMRGPEYSSQLAYAKYRGNISEVYDLEKKHQHMIDNAAADARTAWVAFAVAMTGLACSKP